MAGHNELGKLGEELAVDFLLKNHYKILQTNWVYQKAEIDIIALKDNILAIVEVKTRSSLEFGLPQEFVTPKKIKLLVKAVDEYIIQNGVEADARFDIVSIHNNKGDFVIEHIEGAFFYF